MILQTSVQNGVDVGGCTGGILNFSDNENTLKYKYAVQNGRMWKIALQTQFFLNKLVYWALETP